MLLAGLKIIFFNHFWTIVRFSEEVLVKNTINGKAEPTNKLTSRGICLCLANKKLGMAQAIRIYAYWFICHSMDVAYLKKINKKINNSMKTKDS